MTIDHPDQVQLRARAAFRITLAVVAMRVGSLPGAVAFVSDGPLGPPRFSPKELENVVDSVLGLRILWWSPNCWKRSLVLRRLLRENGHDAVVVFGVRKDPHGVAGHAWLEKDGMLIGERPMDRSFLPYFRYPGGPV